MAPEFLWVLLDDWDVLLSGDHLKAVNNTLGVGVIGDFYLEGIGWSLGRTTR